MSAQQINILSQVNTLMVRRSILKHRIERAFMSGNYDAPEVAEMLTFFRAARDRAQFLMAQLG